MAVAATSGKHLESDQSYTFSIRAVGEMKPKPQGAKELGFATAEECLDAEKSQPDKMDKTIVTKPYGVAVGLFVYSFLALGLKIGASIVGLIIKMLGK